MTLGSHCNVRQEIRFSKTRAEIKTLHKNSKRLFKSQLSSALHHFFANMSVIFSCFGFDVDLVIT